jgi:Trypsin-like peptidase domain
MNRLFWCVLAMFVALGRLALADEVSTYAQIEPSLALIAAGTGKDFGLGTAFCVEDADGYGFLLTNKHVIGSDPHPRVLLMSDPRHVHYAAIVRVAEIDAAVLAIRADCQPVSMSGSAPAVGTRVAIAGFPAFQLSMFERGLGLSPSFHEGTVSSVIADGAYLEYDAQTDHGNSGSPLFDVDTGQVYGLVTAVNTGTTGALQNNISIGSVALEAFLQNAHHDIEVGLAAVAGKARTSASNDSRPSRSAATGTGKATSLGDQIFDTYIPLNSREQDYDCGSGRRYTMYIRRYGEAGAYYTVTEITSGFSSDWYQSTLQAHDNLNDILLVGRFEQPGSPLLLPKSFVAVPIRPSRSFTAKMELSDGSTSTRMWRGSSTLDVPAGHYDVEIYAETNDRTGATSTAAYADQVGLVAIVLWSKDRKLLFDCGLTGVRDLQ